MAQGRILRAVESVLRNLRFRPVRSSALPADARAECERLEERRLLSTHVQVGGGWAIYDTYWFDDYSFRPGSRGQRRAAGVNS